GEPFEINPLVDFYNAVSLRHVVPAGAFELDRLAAPVELRITREGDTFHSLDEEAPVALPAGEIAYASGPTVLTRHFVWRQSVEGLIRPETRDVLLLSEVAGQVGREVAEAVAEDFRAGVATHFGASIEPAILSAEQTSASW
ncbi:MAG TPA: phenylalanine--tRNA ligase beta subunit-related protein, partial [Thermomicrobiales bacterium]|nr:phenylalanine--tRNA ligase beta subunit-related protein [Thermomicrobiales bacterium]